MLCEWTTRCTPAFDITYVHKQINKHTQRALSSKLAIWEMGQMWLRFMHLCVYLCQFVFVSLWQSVWEWLIKFYCDHGRMQMFFTTVSLWFNDEKQKAEGLDSGEVAGANCINIGVRIKDPEIVIHMSLFISVLLTERRLETVCIFVSFIFF